MRSCIVYSGFSLYSVPCIFFSEEHNKKQLFSRSLGLLFFCWLAWPSSHYHREEKALLAAKKQLTYLLSLPTHYYQLTSPPYPFRFISSLQYTFYVCTYFLFSILWRNWSFFSSQNEKNKSVHIFPTWFSLLAFLSTLSTFVTFSPYFSSGERKEASSLFMSCVCLCVSTPVVVLDLRFLQTGVCIHPTIYSGTCFRFLKNVLPSKCITFLCTCVFIIELGKMKQVRCRACFFLCIYFLPWET